MSLPLCNANGKCVEAGQSVPSSLRGSARNSNRPTTPQRPFVNGEKNRPRTGLILAIMLSVATSIILTGVIITTPPLTDYGSYTAAQRTLYTTVSTVVATIVTTCIIGQVRSGYLHRVDDKLSTLVRGSGYSQPQLQSLSSSWRTVLGVGSLNESRSNFTITVILSLSALITTCITSGFTPTLTTRTVPYNSSIPSGDPYIYAQSWPTNAMPYGTNHDLVWNLHNGSNFLPWTGRGGAPAQEGAKLMGSINVLNPAAYAYLDEGVAVHSSAIGTPLSFYISQSREGAGLPGLIQRYGESVVEVSACVPVMVRNPFQCSKGGVVTFPNNGQTMQVSSEDGTCTFNESIPAGPFKTTLMMKGQCLQNAVGQAITLFGATYSYHEWLAVSVGEKLLPPNEPGQVFSVQCNVDTRNVFEYRNVVLTLFNGNSTGHIFNRFLRSNGPCIPTYPSSIRDALFATAATANAYPLGENRGNSGWFRTINEATSRSGGYGTSANDSFRTAPWAFEDSQNALEDVLGLTAGLVSARIFENSSLVQTYGTARISFTRVGPGKLFAMVYAVPSFLCALVLLYLLFSIRKRGDMYESSKLEDLIDLGKALR